MPGEGRAGAPDLRTARPALVGPADWLAWRELRLEALLDAPGAFGRTHADQAGWGEDRWRALLARPGAWWLVRRPDLPPVAMAAAWERSGAAWLGAVYVTPAARGQGHLDALVSAGLSWAREQSLPLRLEVHEANARARRAYARLGFVPTGERVPYPLGPGDELVLELPSRSADGLG